MLQSSLRDFHSDYELLFQEIKTATPYCSYDSKKHLIVFETSQRETMGYIRLPLHLSLDEGLNITDDESLVIYLSIAAGKAAIIVLDGTLNEYHTTFSSYMTRKKQGYSQIKYLNKKGKSRAGSRVRLASSLQFFEDINTTLQELFEEFTFDRIALKCTPTLIPFLHDAKVSCPFEKQDERLYKIPVHIQESNFTNLSTAIESLSIPTLFYHENYQHYFEEWL